MSDEELATSSGQPSPGAVLAQAREALGVTQREVSDALNLPITTIDAIESEDKSRLPAHVFTRGYVRAYAKLLEVDPDPLVAAWAADQHVVENAKPLLQATSPSAIRLADLSLERVLRNPRGMAGAGLAVVLLIVLIWSLTSSETPADEEPRSAPETSEDHTQEVDAIDPVSAGGNAGVTGAESPPRIEQAVMQAQATVEIDGDTVRRLTSAGNDRLSLQFVEECWVEIKDAEGNVLFGDLGQTGQSMDFIGAGPFSVLLGYAPGAALSFNAEPVALAPHTRNNVANLVLGQ
jgi:cytoskeleton protein RodZ